MKRCSTRRWKPITILNGRFFFFLLNKKIILKIFLHSFSDGLLLSEKKYSWTCKAC